MLLLCYENNFPIYAMHILDQVLFFQFEGCKNQMINAVNITTNFVQSERHMIMNHVISPFLRSTIGQLHGIRPTLYI